MGKVKLQQSNWGTSISRFLPTILFLVACPILAEDDGSLQELMQLLEQQTSLATRTRINIDYVPGMVSVITGDQLRRRGYATLWEALEAIPGIQNNIDATGQRGVIVRGIGKATETSKIKILLNDIPLNTIASASSGTLFHTPVSQIERFEFVRGPGSAIHGEFALMGVLNVVTRTENSGMSARTDSNRGTTIQGMHTFGEPGDKSYASLNIAASEKSGENIEVGPDRSAGDTNSYAPGPINNKLDTLSMIFQFSRENTEVSAQYQEVSRGDHFGINNYLPPPKKQTVVSDAVLSLGLKHSFSIGQQTDATVRLIHVENRNEKNRQFMGTAPAFGGLVSQDDVISNVLLDESRDSLSLDFISRRGSHKFLSEFALSRQMVDESYQAINLDPQSNLPGDTLTEFPSPVSTGTNREVLSVVLQDEYQLQDNVTLTGGLRYDRVDDGQDHLAPRIALVWILGNEGVIKTQYAEAFRPPTLREIHSPIAGNIKSETIDTLEVSYIRNTDTALMRHTLHVSRIDNFIAFHDSAPFGYMNTRGARLSGYELEFERDISTGFSIGGALGLQKSEDLETGKPVYGSVPVTLTLGTNYELMPELNLNIQLAYSGKGYRQNSDSRPKADDTTRIDLSMMVESLMQQRGLNLAFGVRNLFDEKIGYLAPQMTYRDDYTFTESAEYWLSLEYSF
jgi:iron complex outermembrane receptor protein